MPLLTSTPADGLASRPRPLSPRWWVRDEDGKVNLVQWPNPALVVWMLAAVLAWTEVLGSSRTAALHGVGSGALVAWALDELIRGASPARRLMGAVVLAVQLVRLFG
ncbi:hypothetical protein [Pedococcus bigeumensis]|uniref:Uncharacterized protein n=1 Tax=Pedococcus bigeumensis TaxID=433644 RepID=A0A502D138_9MICO|nr:hypothetical protein [Pedococcus bigeumensis]TPG17836.1 hypothetical protein EAH86_05205 [Pedococcus bigeumensis]